MDEETRRLLEEIREQNREILRLLNREEISDGGLTVAMLMAAPDPLEAIRERNRRLKLKEKKGRNF